MPTYLYRRKDGSTFEIEQRITEPALTGCPTTGQSVTRLISRGAGFVLKGTGFYQTDYARKSTNGSTDSGTGDKKKPSKKKTEASTESASKTSSD